MNKEETGKLDWTSPALGVPLNGETMGGLLDKCESPIERAFLAAICLMIRAVEDDMETSFPFDELRVSVQHQVMTYPGTYRADIAIWRVWGQHKLIIECDGHDFHERTPEQAANDRQRDRAMTLAGCTVLRFTGTEITRYPTQCAVDVLCAIEKFCKARIEGAPVE